MTPVPTGSEAAANDRLRARSTVITVSMGSTGPHRRCASPGAPRHWWGHRPRRPRRLPKSTGNSTFAPNPVHEPAGVASLNGVAVKASREFVIEAPPEKVMEVLGDVGVLESWSPLHKRMEVIDYYPDGRPHHVKATIKILGLVDKEILEYHWGPDWVCWDAEQTFQQHGQHIEYTVKPEGVDRTRVRFDITVDAGLVPGFIVKRASEHVLAAAAKGLRDLLAGPSDQGPAK